MTKKFNIITADDFLEGTGVETKLIIEKTTQQDASKPHADSKRAIQDAVRKGILWHEALLSGKASGIDDLARQNNVGEKYVTQLIKFAFLSPDVIRQVFKGNLPHDFTLGKLKENFDTNWEKQYSLFQLPNLL